MKFKILVLALVAFTSVTRTSAATCERCRAFDLTLSCVEEANKAQSVYNGYKCSVMSGANVQLNCSLDDSSGYDLTYEWYKSSSIEGKSFKDQSSGSQKIENCTSSSCTLYDVKWSTSSDVSAHDSQFYQCIVSVQSNATAVATFFSNALALDVQSYVAPTVQDADTHSVDVGTTEVKLACPIPDTNPVSSVVWVVAANASSNSSSISSVDNMFVVQDTLKATDSKYGYSNGMLVIMNFKGSNAGVYTCSVKHVNSFGTTTQREVSVHTISSTGVTKASVSESLRVVSQVISPDFLFKDTDETVFHCLGSNLVAGDTANHYWQIATDVNGVEMYKNLTGSGWTLSNYNRTLTVDKSYTNTGVKYRCQIQKGSSTILLNDFTQASIIPKSVFVPPAMQCATNNSTYTAVSDALMTSDVTATGVIQVLAGSSFYWQQDGESITKFDSGYTVSSTQLSYVVNSAKQCHYLQQFKYISGLYAVQQIHSLSVFDVSEITASTPTVQIAKSGGDTVTITCIGAVDTYSSDLENKIGLNVLFDVGGCIEYADAVVSVSDSVGTCTNTVTRTLQINTKKLCSDCVIKCKAATNCKSSDAKSQTISPDMTVEQSSCVVCGKTGTVGLGCDNATEAYLCTISDTLVHKINSTGKTGSCDGNTEASTDSEIPTWGIALIVIAVLIGLLGIIAIFFYTYMQKKQGESDSKIMGAAVLKVNAGDDKLKTTTEAIENSPVIKMPTFSGFGDFFNAESTEEGGSGAKKSKV